MYEVLPSFVLGFHGCDLSIAEDVFAGKRILQPSANEYDWIGHGIYFWENSPTRAAAYAQQLKLRPGRSRGKVRQPAVIGAVIDLGHCLNLLNAEAIDLVTQAHSQLTEAMHTAGAPMPVNRAPRGSADLLLRNLDCAVIEFVHKLRAQDQSSPFQSVRAAFIEGEPIYQTAGFHRQTHIQICVRDPACIKGYFRPMPAQR